MPRSSEGSSSVVSGSGVGVTGSVGTSVSGDSGSGVGVFCTQGH
jgi:hypothetical protein